MVNDNSIMGRVTKIYFPIKARQICQPLRLPYQSPIIITEYFWSNDNYNNGNDKDNKNDDNNDNMIIIIIIIIIIKSIKFSISYHKPQFRLQWDSVCVMLVNSVGVKIVQRQCISI